MVSCVALETTEPGELADILRPGSGDVVATAGGPFKAKAVRLDLDRLWMQHIDESVPRVWNVGLTKHRMAIWFLTNPGPAVSFQGIQARPDAIGLCPVGQTVCQTLTGPSAWGSMSLTLDDWAELSEVAGRDLVVSVAGLASAPRAADIVRLQRMHRAAARMASDTPEIFQNPEVARGIQQALIQAVVECFQAAEPHPYLPARRRSAIIRRLFAVLEEIPDAPIHIPDLCTRVGVPSRTLRTVCNEYLGMGPKKYLHLRRLHLVRRVLRAAEGETTVTQVATRFGFWELGRFAVEYRALFGESPSATLRRAGVVRPVA